MKPEHLIASTTMILVISVLIFDSPTLAAVLHPDGEPPTLWSDKPSDNVLGRWGSSGSCVAIAPDFVITTRHQGGGVGTTVVIGGNSYTVSQVWNHASADIRIAKLSGANLTEYVGLCCTTDELGKEVVIGGYGKGRGDELTNGSGTVYGYLWAGNDNQTLRWGTNIVDAAGDRSQRGYTSSTLRADFDILSNGTTYEAAPAEWDSGGGWFVKVDDQWQVVALNAYVEHEGETWFLNTQGAVDPDMFWGIRVSTYSGWANSIIPEPATLMLLSIGSAFALIRRRK
ncbi:MAG: hypothetical protein DRN29_11175 [Thermoplasmata archaeon]|nr:MAG: hypothetical protein DRN29_11175 [Thermoplasmata archaeon]